MTSASCYPGILQGWQLFYPPLFVQVYQPTELFKIGRFKCIAPYEVIFYKVSQSDILQLNFTVLQFPTAHSFAVLQVSEICSSSGMWNIHHTAVFTEQQRTTTWKDEDVSRTRRQPQSQKQSHCSVQKLFYHQNTTMAALWPKCNTINLGRSNSHNSQ